MDLLDHLKNKERVISGIFIFIIIYLLGLIDEL